MWKSSFYQVGLWHRSWKQAEQKKSKLHSFCFLLWKVGTPFAKLFLLLFTKLSFCTEVGSKPNKKKVKHILFVFFFGTKKNNARTRVFFLLTWALCGNINNNPFLHSTWELASFFFRWPVDFLNKGKLSERVKKCFTNPFHKTQTMRLVLFFFLLPFTFSTQRKVVWKGKKTLCKPFSHWLFFSLRQGCCFLHKCCKKLNKRCKRYLLTKSVLISKGQQKVFCWKQSFLFKDVTKPVVWLPLAVVKTT